MPKVRDQVKVRFKDTDSHKKLRKPSGRSRYTVKNGPVTSFKVDPRVWEAAHALELREGEQLKFVSATEARTVYK
jgi:hypothetical protein